MTPYYIITALAAALVSLLLWQWRHQRLLALRAHLMREALRNRDFTFRLPTSGLLSGEQALQSALNDTGQEVSRLLARNEVEAWQKLTRILTHEIMNATTPISCITQAYLNDPTIKGMPHEQGIQAINDTCASLNTFVENYRKITQIEKAAMGNMPLEAFIDNVARLFPDLVFHCAIPQNASVHADENMLRQVMMNLLKNAVEAKAHHIDIHLQQTPAQTDILVSNDGESIKPEVAREIFIPFFTTKKSGSGIGLALSRQMMVAQDGDLKLRERPVARYHTTFVLTLQTLPPTADGQ